MSLFALRLTPVSKHQTEIHFLSLHKKKIQKKVSILSPRNSFVLRNHDVAFYLFFYFLFCLYFSLVIMPQELLGLEMYLSQILTPEVHLFETLFGSGSSLPCFLSVLIFLLSRFLLLSHLVWVTNYHTCSSVGHFPPSVYTFPCLPSLSQWEILSESS